MNYSTKSMLQKTLAASMILAVESVLPAWAQAPSQSAAIELDSPSRWDGAFYLPASMPSDVLKHIVGTTFHANALSYLKLSVTDAKTKFEFGKAQVTVTLAVGLDGAPVSAQLEAGGSLSFAKLERDQDGKNPRARFRVMLDTLKPTAKAGDKATPSIDLAEKLRAAGVLDLLEAYLTFSVPVPLDIDEKVSLNDKFSLTAAKDGEVKVNVKAKGFSVNEKVKGLDVVFVPSGVWLCCSYVGGFSPKAVGMGLPPAQRWKAYEAAASKDTARAMIRGKFLSDTFNRLANISPESRTATITGVAHKGKLVDGDADVWISNDSETGSLTVNPSAEWAAAEGLKVKCPYTAWAKADLGFNYDISIGSIGVPSIGCRGSSSGAPTATIAPASLPDPAQTPPPGYYPKAAVLRAEFPVVAGAPQELKLHVETDGSFKTKLPFSKYFKTDVPKIEVDAFLPVPPEILPRVTLLTNKPYPISYPKAPKGFTLTLPEKAPNYFVFDPQKPVKNADGFSFDFKLQLVKLDPKVAAQQGKDVESMLQQSRTTLGKGRFKVSVAGIGPNNDLIKALMAIGKIIGDAYAEAQKVEKNVQATLNKAKADMNKAMGGIPNKALGEVERHVPKILAPFIPTLPGKGGSILPTPGPSSKPKPSDFVPPGPTREIFKKVFKIR